MSFKLNRQFLIRYVYSNFKIIFIFLSLWIPKLFVWSVGKKPTVSLDFKLLFRIPKTKTKIPCI